MSTPPPSVLINSCPSETTSRLGFAGSREARPTFHLPLALSPLSSHPFRSLPLNGSTSFGSSALTHRPHSPSTAHTAKTRSRMVGHSLLHSTALRFHILHG